VLSEVIFDDTGHLSAIETPPGAASKDYRTADIGILKEGRSRAEIAERLAAGEKIKADDIFDAAVDYKTGNARLKKKGAFEALTNLPYVKLKKGGNLAGDLGKALDAAGNAIQATKALKDIDVPNKGLKGLITSAVGAGVFAWLKPVAAWAGPAGDVLEGSLGAAKVYAAEPEDRARVAQEETFGFGGGLLGAGLGALGVGLICSTGWGCLILGIGAAGAGGYAGDKGGRTLADAIPEGSGSAIGREDDNYIYYPGEAINKKTGRFELRPGPKF